MSPKSPRMEGRMQLAYLGLEVADPEAWRTFATTILGLMPAEGRATSWDSSFRMDECERRFMLAKGEKDDLSFAGFAVANRDVLDELRGRLETAGYRTTDLNEQELADRPVRTGFWCEDPFGHRLEFGYGLASALDVPFRSPAGLGFVAGELGLGHIVLSAPDMDKADKFYRQTVGLHESDSIDLDDLGPGVSATFYHCNPRHHSLALLNAPHNKRLHHFMVELETIDDLGRAHDRCVDAKTPLATTIGRHTNDRMISFYAVSPSGFAVEIGTGGRQIDVDTWKVEAHDRGSYWGHRLVDPNFIEG